MKGFTSIILVAVLFSSGAFAQSGERQKQFNINEQHIAIKGYDPVVYFTEHKAKESRLE